MKTVIISILALGFIGLSNVSHSASLDYDSRWGWFPDQFTPRMALFNDSLTEAPVLGSDALTITNNVPSRHIYYSLTGTNLAIPTNLWLEAQLRVLRNQDTSGGKRTASCIQFSTSTNVGNTLWIGLNEIFIGNGEFTRGPSAILDTTTNFHIYRVEVNGVAVGNAVQVFQDGVLKLTGVLYQGADDNGDPSVSFGDTSFYASGGAEWRTFACNAAVATPFVQPRLFIGPPQSISLHGLPGRNYNLETTTNITQSVWPVVTNLTLTTNAWGTVGVLPDNSPQRFYRAVQSP